MLIQSGQGIRLTPHFCLKRVSQLTAWQRSSLGPLPDGGEGFSVLLSDPQVGLGAKLIDPLFAVELEQISRTGLVTSSIDHAKLWNLVVNGVLEIETADGYRHGPGVLPDAEVELEGAKGYLDILARDAIQHAMSLAITDLPRLAARTYFFNREPRTGSEHERRIESAVRAEAQEWLQFRGGRLGFKERTPHLHDKWQFFSHRRQLRMKAGEGCYKLYVSPVFEKIPGLIAPLFSTFASQGVCVFKVGTDAAGLKRPDKIVAYFGSKEHLDSVAQAIVPLVPNDVVHGVPFTCQIPESSAISWGMDPPVPADRPPLREVESWRLWICNRIASAILLVRASSRTNTKETPAISPILSYLKWCGVDLNKWCPSQRLREEFSIL